ncbi:hypothetical protein OH77DRAFT_175760 [Trametes cingulata]|nr:hypothetical protein OH77DRAFT_175760 [Trametes cingulata]
MASRDGGPRDHRYGLVQASASPRLFVSFCRVRVAIPRRDSLGDWCCLSGVDARNLNPDMIGSLAQTASAMSGSIVPWALLVPYKNVPAHDRIRLFGLVSTARRRWDAHISPTQTPRASGSAICGLSHGSSLCPHARVPLLRTHTNVHIPAPVSRTSRNRWSSKLHSTSIEAWLASRTAQLRVLTGPDGRTYGQYAPLELCST